MRILLDENVPRQLKTHLVAHAVSTVMEMGWTSVKNGKLLALAESRFDILITADKGIGYQQNRTGASLILVTFQVRQNKLEHFVRMLAQFEAELAGARPGDHLRLVELAR